MNRSKTTHLLRAATPFSTFSTRIAALAAATAMAGCLAAAAPAGAAEFLWLGLDPGPDVFSNAGQWGGSASVPTNGSDLRFFAVTNSAYPITADVNRTFNAIEFNGTSDFQISSGGGGTLLGLSGGKTVSGFSGGTTLLNINATDQTLNIANLQVTGSQNWVQTVANGTINIQGNATLNAGTTVSFYNLDGTASTISANVTGDGGFNKIGSGTLVLSGTNSYLGGTNIETGTVQVSKDANLGATASHLSLDGATLHSTGSFSTARGTTLDSGGGTVNVDSGKTVTHNGDIDGSGDLVKTGAGTLALGGNNTFTGDIDINAGALRISQGASLGASGGTLTIAGTRLETTGTFATQQFTVLSNGGGTIDVASGTTFTHNGGIFGSGAKLTKTGDGTLVLGGLLGSGNNGFGGLRIEGGTVEASTDAAFGNSAGNIVIQDGALRAAATFSTARATDIGSGLAEIGAAAGATFTHNGAIEGSGILLVSGGGTVVLDGANSYSGGTFVTGTVEIDSNARLGAGGAGVALLGGTLRNSADFTLARDIYAGNLFGGGGSGTIETDAGRTLTHSGVLSGGTLNKTGDGTLVLTGANTHTDATRVSGGALRIAQDASLGAASAALVLETGGTLRTTANFGTARQTTLDGGEGVFETAAGTTLTHTGAISGTGDLAKTGGGTLVLGAGGSSAYDGATDVRDGTLRVENRTSQFNGAFANNATTEIEGANVTFAQGAVNDGTFVSNNSTMTFGGGFVNNGTLITDPNTMNFTDWTNTDPAATIAASGDQFNVSGDLLGDTANRTTWDTDEAILRFVAGSDNAHAMQLYGIDLGVGALGLADNFAWGTVELEGGQTVSLDDVKADGEAGALYLDTILLADFATDIGDLVIDSILGNGFNVYYNALADGNLYLGGFTYDLGGGGQLIAWNGDGSVYEPPTAEAPEPGMLALFGMGALGLGWARRRAAGGTGSRA